VPLTAYSGRCRKCSDSLTQVFSRLPISAILIPRFYWYRSTAHLYAGWQVGNTTVTQQQQQHSTTITGLVATESGGPQSSSTSGKKWHVCRKTGWVTFSCSFWKQLSRVCFSTYTRAVTVRPRISYTSQARSGPYIKSLLSPWLQQQQQQHNATAEIRLRFRVRKLLPLCTSQGGAPGEYVGNFWLLAAARHEYTANATRYMVHYGKTWCHLQNRKYITYCSVIRATATV